MTYLFTALLIAAIGYAVYRTRASFRDTTLPPLTGAADDTAADSGKPDLTDKR